MPNSLKLSLFFMLLICQASLSYSMSGRFGVGITNQPETNLDNISFKVHSSKRTAYGGVIGASNADNGGYVMGLKLYRKLIQEENLNFFGALFGAYRNEGPDGAETSGFQGDLTFGVEFFFQGLDHLGFSFETGLSVNTFSEFEFKTQALNMVQGAIHFYL